MRVVNLARDPYLNHRPVFRLSVLLWTISAMLLIVNGWQYWTHWSGVDRNQDLLEGLASAIRQEELRLKSREAELGGIDIWSENTRTRYVNALISQRKFPWSALFEDLEEILPAEIKLTTVQPSVRLANDPDRIPKKPPRRSRRSRRRTGGAQQQTTPAASPEVEKPDEVRLILRGSARKEEALMGFVDALYRDPAFLNPDLSTEQLDSRAGSSEFNISVVYLTRRPQVASPAELTADTGGAGGAGVVIASDEEPTGDLIAGGRNVPGAQTAGSDDVDERESLAALSSSTAGEVSSVASAEGTGVVRTGMVGAEMGDAERESAPEQRASSKTRSEPGEERAERSKQAEKSRRGTEQDIPSRDGRSSASGRAVPESSEATTGSVGDSEQRPTATRPNASDNPRIRGGGSVAVFDAGRGSEEKAIAA